jgi:4-carboxymuconolactone decarboxylase
MNKAMDDAERVRQGMTVRRAVLGDEHVDRAVAGTTSFTEPFQDLITRYAWGEIWSRPGLSRAERSIVTLTVLAALQHEGELAMHVKAALRNGLSPEQIREVLLQVTVYAGVPVGNRAFAIAQRALAEAAEGELPAATPSAPIPSPVKPGIHSLCSGSLSPGIGSLAAELA